MLDLDPADLDAIRDVIHGLSYRPERKAKMLAWLAEIERVRGAAALPSSSERVRCTCGGIMLSDGGSHASTCPAYKAALPSDGLRARLEDIRTRAHAIAWQADSPQKDAFGWVVRELDAVLSVLPVEGGGEPEQGDDAVARVDGTGDPDSSSPPRKSQREIGDR